MEKLEIHSTPNTPYIKFDHELGEMIIKGRAIPDFSGKFWEPLIKWLYVYSISPLKETKFIFEMEYYNHSSAKQLLFILHKLNDILEKGYEVIVEWRYAEDDIEMKEAGRDFECVGNVPFQYVEVRRQETVL